MAIGQQQIWDLVDSLYEEREYYKSMLVAFSFIRTIDNLKKEQGIAVFKKYFQPLDHCPISGSIAKCDLAPHTLVCP